MSTGKRLAKRSIIGTRVCAPGDDGKYYSGVISAVNTPTSPQQPELGGLNITANTRYSVRFDPVPAGQGKAPDSKNEYSDRDLIGSGFNSVTGVKLVPGQKVYLTYNGREIHAEVVQHRQHLDEVDVVAPSGEGTMSLTRRIDELRLMESRKSARLADSDTDFARLADMGSDRKRASSHSIDVPQVIGSRKRRPSSSNESERSYNGWNDRTNDKSTGQGGNCMDECTAAVVLMSLSTPPKTSLPIHCQHTYGSWDDRVSSSSSGSHNLAVAGSPGVVGSGTFNSSSSSSSSSASWRSGTPSPPLSDEGAPWPNGAPPTSANNVVNASGSNNNNNNNNSSSSSNNANHLAAHPVAHNHQRYYQYHNNHAAGSSSSSSPNFTTHDEGIVADLDHERPRKKKIRCRVENDDNVEDSANAGESSDNDVKSMTIYKCTWRDESNRSVRCGEVSNSWNVVAEHVLRTHLNGKKNFEDEEDFYIDEQPEPTCSPPTKSHWDMVRPRSEDPEYQKQLRLAASPAQNSPQVAAAVNTQDIIIRDVFSMASRTPSKQFKPSPRPLQAYNASNISVVTVSLGKMPHSPRRVRGETKKCRKVYGMEHKELWCTQCKWKKACTRFSD